MTPVTVRKLVRGEIQIGNDVYRENLVLQPTKVIPGWAVADTGSIVANDFAKYLSTDTEIVLLGTGWETRIPDRELVFAMARRGIGFESMQTPAACRTFNILAGEGRAVTAFLIIH
jgi:uncharacterized protein